MWYETPPLGTKVDLILMDEMVKILSIILKPWVLTWDFLSNALKFLTKSMSTIKTYMFNFITNDFFQQIITTFKNNLHEFQTSKCDYKNNLHEFQTSNCEYNLLR